MCVRVCVCVCVCVCVHGGWGGGIHLQFGHILDQTKKNPRKSCRNIGNCSYIHFLVRVQRHRHNSLWDGIRLGRSILLEGQKTLFSFCDKP